MPKELFEYICKVGTRPTAGHKGITDYTAKLGRSSLMCISADEGQFIEFMTRTVGAVTCVEVGCFTGYGTLSLALGSTGTVYTLDIGDEHLANAKKQWHLSGVLDRIEHVKAPALKSMKLLEQLGTGPGAAAAVRKALADAPAPSAELKGAGSVDMVFVDADKSNYASYVESAYTLLRQGGVCLVDNTIWFGKVIDPSAVDPDTLAIKALNASLASDERWEVSMVAIADGVTMLRKR
jgi:O-methyltransferase